MVYTCHIARIERGDVTNPIEGLGYTIWFQGCSIRCSGCHNKSLWSPLDGKIVDCNEIIEDIAKNQHWIRLGMVVYLGGEPTDQPRALNYIQQAVRKMGLRSMLYTGRELEELARVGVRWRDFDFIKTGRYGSEQRIFTTGVMQDGVTVNIRERVRRNL